MLRAGTKGPTRTNQRTFDQVAINIQGSKYASDATPSMRTRLYFGLPSNCRRVDEQRRRCRWLKFMSDGTTPIPTARMAIPSLPAGRFWRSRDTPRRILLAKLLVSSRWPNTLAFIQVSRDWIRFCPLRFSFSPVPCPFCLTHRHDFACASIGAVCRIFAVEGRTWNNLFGFCSTAKSGYARWL